MAKKAVETPKTPVKTRKTPISKAKQPAEKTPAKKPERELAGSWIREFCTKAELSILMGISIRALSDMDARGLLVRGHKTGSYRTVPSLNARFQYLQEMASGRLKERENPLAEERTRAARIDRQISEITLAKLQGEVLLLDETSEAWSEFATKVKAAMLSWPSKARLAIPHLTAHDAAELKRIVLDALEDLAKEIEGSVVSGDANDFKA